MLGFSNTNPNGGSKGVSISDTFVSGNAGMFCLWNATAQSLLSSRDVPNNVYDEAARTATTCYMRGLSERLRIQTSSGRPWFWRRICFTYKQFIGARDTGETPLNPEVFYIATDEGISRQWLNLTINNSQGVIDFIRDLVFRGQEGIDWNDVTVARADNRVISVKYDKLMTIKSGNDNGTVRELKFFHRMNSNLIYDDDERGEGTTPRYNSTEAKPGMGNYYVLDIIQPGTGAGEADLMQIKSSSTLYWHEK